MGCFVEGCIAGGAGVDAAGGHVLVVFAGEGRFGTFFSDDAELFWGVLLVLSFFLGGGKRGVPFERTACHSSSDFWTG